jgi:CRP-like cAMP-binding protein
MRESEYLIPKDDLLKRLKGVPTLSHFEDEDLQVLIRYSKIRQYDSGDAIIKEDHHDTWLFFLISGVVRITKKGKDIATLNKTGDIFGEMGIIEDSVRSASAFAVEDTVCLAANASDVDTISGSDRYAFGYVLYRLFSQFLAKRLRLTTEKLIQETEEGVDLTFEWE